MKTNSLWAETLQAILNRLVLLKVDLMDLKMNFGFNLDATQAKVDESADLVRDLLYGKDETIRRLGIASSLQLVGGRPEGPPEGMPPGK